ncbi:MAG: hypothetical protein MI717_09625 [Spirochaetales bacterium]|nr:hypothetical protein [Spirochaetales bacterium]
MEMYKLQLKSAEVKNNHLGNDLTIGVFVDGRAVEEGGKSNFKAVGDIFKIEIKIAEKDQSNTTDFGAIEEEVKIEEGMKPEVVIRCNIHDDEARRYPDNFATIKVSFSLIKISAALRSR